MLNNNETEFYNVCTHTYVHIFLFPSIRKDMSYPVANHYRVVLQHVQRERVLIILFIVYTLSTKSLQPNSIKTTALSAFAVNLLE